MIDFAIPEHEGQTVSPKVSETHKQVIVLANRQPYAHERDCQGHITLRRSPAGVVNAVEPLLMAHSGVWVAHGSGSGDRQGAPDRDGLYVPPANPAYRLRRVWLSELEERGYYDGYANGALWPLCHRVYAQPVFRSEDYTTYRTVNARFAEAVCDEAITDTPIVLVQDYHFALAPLMIRTRLPQSEVVTFWHIPWPECQTFSICPNAREIIEGLLGSSVVGFQTAADCRNFFDAAERIGGAHVNRADGVITHRGRRVLVRDYPASIEWPGQWASGPPIHVCRSAVRRDLRLDERVLLGVGVDRLDYTKGLEEKFLSVERLLESHPEFLGRFVFVQLSQPSRCRVAAYRDARRRFLDLAEHINRRFSAGEYRPILVLEAQHSPASIARYFRAADVCVVGSLHDGMNLVSKEFVAARDDERGVLMLSAFAGAACELKDALIINPYDTDGAATALATALRMSPEEQGRRMRRLRSVVRKADAHRWASRILANAIATSGQRSRRQLLAAI